MAAISPGKPVSRPKMPTKPTPATNIHRFEPFSKRISRLKIDPVHRLQRDAIQDHDDISSSKFRNTLEKWTDLNLSANFTEFRTKVEPFSVNLPQLLHHADKIMGILLEHIRKGDSISIEPLLLLLADFAYDLGALFENYFSDAVTTVASLAARQDAADVIEWSFTCLAWIFRFLSRLLVPDLRPVLKIMLPYLGMSRQKYYISRFAAESMAFLIKKAGINYDRHPEHLRNATLFLLEQLHELQDQRQTQSFQNGLMTLFSGAIRGIESGIHTCGPFVYHSLVEQAISFIPHDSRLLDVVQGVTINLIHNTDREGFEKIQDVITDRVSKLNQESRAEDASSTIALYSAIIGTRKGTRVTKWRLVNQSLLDLMRKLVGIRDCPRDTIRLALITLAMDMQYSPIADLTFVLNPYFDLILETPFREQFLPFCQFADNLGHERFAATLLPVLQKYIAKYWSEDQAGLCLLLEYLSELGLIQSKSKDRFICPKDWEEQVIEKYITFNLETISKVDAAQLSAFTRLGNRISFPGSQSSKDRLVKALRGHLYSISDFSETSSRPGELFLLGDGLKLLRQLDLADMDQSLRYNIFRNAHRFVAGLPFLQGLHDLLEGGTKAGVAALPETDQLISALINNLLSPSLELKTQTIRVLEMLMESSDDTVIGMLSLALEILETPYNLHNVRQLSMLIRRIGPTQRQFSATSNVFPLLPSLCLGLLSKSHSSVLEDLCSSILQICETPSGEEFVFDIIIKWLQSPEERIPEQNNVFEEKDIELPKVTAFECTNLQKQAQQSKIVFDHFENATQSMVSKFENFNKTSDRRTPLHARSLSLQVLNAMPQLAEKRSRFLVPLFLMTAPEHDYISAATDSSASASSHTLSPEIKDAQWSYPAHMHFLELLGKFNNPKVLYKSSEVYHVLLQMLSTGNAEIQKLSLKAIFTWKGAAICPYEENLMRLLDEKTFRDELALILFIDGDKATISENHRSDVLPVLLRLLYGQMVNRASNRGNHGGQEVKRKAIMRSLFKMRTQEISLFLDIAFGPTVAGRLNSVKLSESPLLDYDTVPLEQQYGVSKMVESMLETLKTQLSPFGEQILIPVLYCTIRASRRLHRSDHQDIADKQISLARSIRRAGIHCLDILFSICVDDFDWKEYIPMIYIEIIQPRLENFALETAQGISGLLRLFGTWSNSAPLVQYLKQGDELVLNAIGQCISTPSSIDEVKIFTLDRIIAPIAHLAADKENGECAREIVYRSLTQWLSQMNFLLNNNTPRRVLDSAIETLASLTPFAQVSTASDSLLASLATVLELPSDKVGPRSKGTLLLAVRDLLKIDGDLRPALHAQIYKTVASLFNYFQDSQNRRSLTEILHVLVKDDPSLTIVADICSDLNAISATRLDNIDYERRLQSFRRVTDIGSKFNATHWQPILGNLLYFSRSEDFAIRSNAFSCLRSFVETGVNHGNSDVESLIRERLLPAIKKSSKIGSESIRADYVSLFGLVVRMLPEWPDLADMRCLLADNDDEASFFTNILHIQHHRRLRAMRRLVSVIDTGQILASNICTFFLPLLEKFIFDVESDDSADGLRGNAISTIGSLLQWTEWTQFKAIFRRYRGYMDSKPDAEKDIVKLLGVTSNALYASAQLAWKYHESLPDASNSVLTRTLPSQSKVAIELTSTFIPKLTMFIHQKEESQVTLRIPTAIAAVKLLRLLPPEEMAILLPPVLLDISHILRSRDQGTRDIARNTLSDIAMILGPSHFEYILKELKASLSRGYQLHVLSYTVHSVLIAIVPHLQPGDLDHCVQSLVHVILDDIFGAIGQEKDSEDYITKAKEVKSSKSFDSMELLAETISIKHLAGLLRPLRDLTTGNLSSKQSRQVDELLRRLGVGLSHNAGAGSQDVLIFAYEVFQDVYAHKPKAADKILTKDENNRHRFLIQLSSSNKSGRGSSASSVHKLAKFALDAMRSTFQKRDHLLTTENVHGLLPVVGDALLQSQEDVKTSALRLISVILKLPIPEIDENAQLYIAEAVKIVRAAISTSSESAQAALKLVTSILRDRRSSKIRDSDLAYLLHRILPDLEEPDRQGVTFNFIKAIMARKYMLPEVYELVDKLGAMMVTSHSRVSRDAARGVYVHFLVEFPQSNSRWAKQVKFLVKNLSYQHHEGRQSVMEALNTLLVKVGGDIAEEVIGSSFIPVVLLMANDEQTECREMAAALIGQIFVRADSTQLQSILGTLQTWLQETENDAVNATGMQAYKILFERLGESVSGESKFVLDCIEQVLESNSRSDDKSKWQSTYHALQLFTRLCNTDPSSTMSEQRQSTWMLIQRLLSHPHPWVQSSIASIIGTWFHDAAKTSAPSGLARTPLSGSNGLSLDQQTMRDLLKASLRLLRRTQSSKQLSTQLTRNLVFLGRCFNVNGQTINRPIKRSMGSENGQIDEEEDEAPENQEFEQIPALQYLIIGAANILRHEVSKPRTQSLVPKIAALQLLGAVCNNSDTSNIQPIIATIMLPLAHLSDPSIPAPRSADKEFQEAYQGLVADAHEVLEILQKKLGAIEYTKYMTEVQRTIRERREGRRSKRRIEAIADPEKFGKEKRRKNDRKTTRRKEKGIEFRGKRRGW